MDISIHNTEKIELKEIINSGETNWRVIKITAQDEIIEISCFGEKDKLEIEVQTKQNI